MEPLRLLLGLCGIGIISYYTIIFGYGIFLDLFLFGFDAFVPIMPGATPRLLGYLVLFILGMAVVSVISYKIYIQIKNRQLAD